MKKKLKKSSRDSPFLSTREFTLCVTIFYSPRSSRDASRAEQRLLYENTHEQVIYYSSFIVWLVSK